MYATHKRLGELPTEKAASRLLGQRLIRTLSDGHQLVGAIVETEAYHESDPAAHTYSGKTERNAVMFGPAGHAYVYFTYGMHYCLNVVTGTEGTGEAVLIRALEPREGVETIHRNRFPDCHSGLVADSTDRKDIITSQVQDDKHYYNLCSGPAKLTQALAINRQLNGHDLSKSPLRLEDGQSVAGEDIVQTTRIGLRRGTETQWRFYIRGNPHVSKP